MESSAFVKNLLLKIITKFEENQSLVKEETAVVNGRRKGFNISDLIDNEECKRESFDDEVILKSLLPSWIFSTRYSSRPNTVKINSMKRRKSYHRTERRPRTCFSETQIKSLMKEFYQDKYLNESRRKRISKELNLKENQVKIWFQNKRAKSKRT